MLVDVVIPVSQAKKQAFALTWMLSPGSFRTTNQISVHTTPRNLLANASTRFPRPGNSAVVVKNIKSRHLGQFNTTKKID
jgi:hypothetical protein